MTATAVASATAGEDFSAVVVPITAAADVLAAVAAADVAAAVSKAAVLSDAVVVVAAVSPRTPALRQMEHASPRPDLDWSKLQSKALGLSTALHQS